jgi:hypothetical protein
MGLRLKWVLIIKTADVTLVVGWKCGVTAHAQQDHRFGIPSAFDNGRARPRGQKPLLVIYLTDSIHVKC